MTTAGVLTHLALVHNVNTSTLLQINGPMWSIAVECQIYVLFPLLILARRRFGILPVVGAIYLLALVLENQVRDTQHKGLMPIYLFVFLLGMYAAEFALGPPKRALIWISGAMAALLLAMLLFPQLRFIADINVVVGILTSSMLVIRALPAGGRSSQSALSLTASTCSTYRSSSSFGWISFCR